LIVNSKQDGFKPGKGFYNIVSENKKSLRAATSEVNFQRFEDRLMDTITNANIYSKEDILKNLWIAEEEKKFNIEDMDAQDNELKIPNFT
jgi:hypothetical protein